VVAVAFSPDGSQIASGDAARIVMVWDAAGTQALLTLSKDPIRIRDLAWSPGGAP